MPLYQKKIFLSIAAFAVLLLPYIGLAASSASIDDLLVSLGDVYNKSNERIKSVNEAMSYTSNSQLLPNEVKQNILTQLNLIKLNLRGLVDDVPKARKKLQKIKEEAEKTGVFTREQSVRIRTILSNTKTSLGNINIALNSIKKAKAVLGVWPLETEISIFDKIPLEQQKVINGLIAYTDNMNKVLSPRVIKPPARRRPPVPPKPPIKPELPDKSDIKISVAGIDESIDGDPSGSKVFNYTITLKVCVGKRCTLKTIQISGKEKLSTRDILNRVKERLGNPYKDVKITLNPEMQCSSTNNVDKAKTDDNKKIDHNVSLKELFHQIIQQFREIQSYWNSIDKLRIQLIQKLRNDIKEYQIEIAKKDKKIKECEQTISGLQNANKELKGKCGALKQDKEKLSRQLEEANKRLEEEKAKQKQKQRFDPWKYQRDLMRYNEIRFRKEHPGYPRWLPVPLHELLKPKQKMAR